MYSWLKRCPVFAVGKNKDPDSGSRVKNVGIRFRTRGHCWEVLLVGAGCRVAMVRLKESKLDKKKCDKCDHRRL